MQRPQVQMPRLCTPQVFTARLKSKISQLPQTAITSGKKTFHFSSPCSRLEGKYRVGRAHKSKVIALCTVNQPALSRDYVIIYMLACILYTCEVRGGLLQETVCLDKEVTVLSKALSCSEVCLETGLCLRPVSLGYQGSGCLYLHYSCSSSVQ